MASVTIQATAQCAGQTHITFQVSGDASRTVVLMRDELLENLTQDDIDAFIKCIAKLAKVGKTPAEWRTTMLGGVTVSA